MPNKDFQMERHYELWKDHNKQMSRWVFAVILVAVLIPWKVLIPYLESSTNLVIQKASLVSANTQLGEIKNNEVLLASLIRQLGTIKTKIRDGSLGQPIETLKRDFRNLNSSYAFLKDKAPQDFFTSSGGGRSSQMNAQVTPNTPGIDAQDFQPLEGLRELQMFHIPINALLEEGFSDPGSRNPKLLSKAKWQALLKKQLAELPQKMADKAILDTVATVNKHAIEPVREIVGNKELVGKTHVLEKLTQQINTLETQVNTWKEKNLGNNQWYQTIRRKGQEIIKITSTIDGFKNEFLVSLEAKKDLIREEKKEYLHAQKDTKKMIQDLEADQQRLELDLKNVLPEWITGFVDIQEIFQLYPLALIGIIGFLGVKANLLRHHFVVLRQGLIPKDLVLQDPSASSIWTLIYRGPWGTLVTVFTYLAITLVFWNLFETGTTLTESWLVNAGEETWESITSHLTFILWLGRIIFFATLIGVGTAIFLDWKNKTAL